MICVYTDQVGDTGRAALLLDKVTSALSVGGEDPSHLHQTYLQHCHPALPVLSLHTCPTLADLPPDLMALVCAKALELQPGLLILQRHIWRLIMQDEAGDGALRQAKLPSIAVALLELSARPRLDIRTDYLLLAKVCACLQRILVASCDRTDSCRHNSRADDCLCSSSGTAPHQRGVADASVGERAPGTAVVEPAHT